MNSYRALESRILRRIFESKKEEDLEWIRFQIYEFGSLYSSLNKVRLTTARRLRWAAYLARMTESGIAFNILTGKPTKNTFLARSRGIWEDNISMDLYKICVNTRNWNDPAQNRGYWRGILNEALILWALQATELVSTLIIVLLFILDIDSGQKVYRT